MMSIQYGEAVACYSSVNCLLIFTHTHACVCTHSYTLQCTNMPIQTYIHTTHTANINKGEEKPQANNLGLSHPCTHLHTLAFGSTGSEEIQKREKGKQKDRTIRVAGIHQEANSGLHSNPAHLSSQAPAGHLATSISPDFFLNCT